jgi:hypothetical protein
MALIFQLAVECANSYEAAVRLQHHFNGASFNLPNGLPLHAKVNELSSDERERWWVSVAVETAGRVLDFKDDPQILRYAGEKLYELLITAHDYRFALAGIEVFQFNDVESLQVLLGNPAMRGLVICEELFYQFGRPPGFKEFSKGYFWLPSDHRYLQEAI